MAATTLVVPAMAIACNDCIEGNCVSDVAGVAVAVTAASTMAVKAAAR